MNDIELLRRYEPVVCYTKGEMFFPSAVDGYLRHCRLWMADSERKTTLLADKGSLDTARLAEFHSVPLNHRLYLQFIARPMPPLDYQRWLRHPERPKFRNPNRLYRVSLPTRIVDTLFDIALLLRGRVPGGTAAAAQTTYAAFPQEDRKPAYYGRVIRDGGYIALHYIYFYVMNDWRSSYYGVNDHESDWEQVFIYLTEETNEHGETEGWNPDTGQRIIKKSAAEPKPRWFACASHDFSGDDLRRRWDDPEVIKVGRTHPVVFAGAGSHASYFSRGEYLMQEEPGFLAPIHNVAQSIERLWRDTLRQGTALNLDSGLRSLLSIPFVDYARGDGIIIGPGGEQTWKLIEISESDGWVSEYRGLWGLDTWDPLGGERAPSGPKYNRDGSVRLSWSNPLAWAGLDKVPPPTQAIVEMERLLVDLKEEQNSLSTKLLDQRDKVRKLELEVQALRQTAFLTDLFKRRLADLAAAERELASLRSRQTDLLESCDAGESLLSQMRVGNFGGPRDHIQHAHSPQPPIHTFGHFGYWWAAVSGGVILLLILLILYFQPSSWIFWLIGIIVLFAGVDAATRGQIYSFLLHLTIILALITSAILVFNFWWLILLLGVILVVVVGIRDNINEIQNG